MSAQTMGIIGYGEVNFVGNFVNISGDLSVDVKGISERRRVRVLKGRLSAANMTIRAGNRFEAKNNTTLSSRGSLHVEASGCVIASNATFEGASSSGSCLASANFNHIPTAIATATPMTGTVPLTVALDASGSSDSDGAIASYSWEVSDGTTLSGVSASKTFNNPGVYDITLTVTDNEGAMSMATLMVTVIRPLESPTASFTYSPQSGDIPLTVSFDGSDSTDPDGSISLYTWIFSDGTTLTGQTAQRTFTEVGTHQVALRVTDNDGLTHQTQNFDIDATQSNLPPVMPANQTFSAKQNMPLTFTLMSATDPEGDPLTYLLSTTPTSGTLSGCLDDTANLECTFTPAADFTGDAIFSYKANDGTSDSPTTSMVAITVAAYNQLPIANAGMDISASFGALVNLDGSGSSDPEMQTLSYSWTFKSKPMDSKSVLAGANSATPSFIADRDGTYIVSLTVNDGKLDSAPDEVVVSVTGQANTAPVLATIASPQTLQMGQELRFTLNATDTDMGDTVVYSAQNMPANARLSSTSGEFRFKPAPTQVGSFTITLSASDGRESVSQLVTITVTAPDPNQVTSLSSRVLDANAYSGDGSIVPIAGVSVSVVGSSVAAVTTDAQGYFTLEGIPAGAQTVSLDASGVSANDGSTYGNFKGRLPIAPNVHNRPHRDYMLPKIDATGMAMVTPNQSATINNTNIGVSFSVPANTAMNTDGSMYNGPLSVSMVPIDATPRELPETLRPNFLITLQPVNVRFANPVPITFPNSDNLPPGSQMEIFSLSEQGGFESVGLGQVSADGQTIRTVSGGIRATTWHFITLVVPVFKGLVSLEGGEGNTNNSQVTQKCDRASEVCIASGKLQSTHSTSALKVQGTSQNLQFSVQNKSNQSKTVVVPKFCYQQINIPFNGNLNSISLPRQMALRFNVKGIDTPSTYFNLSTLNSVPRNTPFSLGQSVDTGGMDTGIYEIEAKLEMISGSVSAPSMRMVKQMVSTPVVSPKTEFGVGIMLQDLHRLYGMNGQMGAAPQKLMIVHGNFNYLVFEKSATQKRSTEVVYTSPKGDYSRLKTVSEPFGGFIREMKDGSKYVFDRTGKLIGKVDRYNRRTSYLYNSDGKLSSIKYPDGRSSVFAYGSDGYVDTITDPVGRITRFEHDSDGNLMQIADPDMSSRGFSYGADGNIISQTDKLGRAQSYAYDNQGSLTSTIMSDGTREQIRSQSTQFFRREQGYSRQPL